MMEERRFMLEGGEVHSGKFMLEGEVHVGEGDVHDGGGRFMLEGEVHVGGGRFMLKGERFMLEGEVHVVGGS